MHPIATIQAKAAATAGTLAGVDAQIVGLCDGTADLDALGVATGLARGALLDRLDALADAGMLQSRVAPPTGVSRRGLLGGLFGATAAAAVGAVLPRQAVAAPAGEPLLPAMCHDASEIELKLAEPSALLQGQDPADALRIAAKLEAGALEARIDAGDAEAQGLDAAAAELAALADAHASLLVEVAADGMLAYAGAAALGDAGPLGREGDTASAIAGAALRHREHASKREAQEAAYKSALAGHDAQVVARYDDREERRKKSEEQFVKAGPGGLKEGASEKEIKSWQAQAQAAAKKVRPGLEAARKKEREAMEMQIKARASALWNGGSDKDAVGFYVARMEEASKKLQAAGDIIDSRQLDEAVAWSATPLEASRRLSEIKRKDMIRQRLVMEATRGTSAKLAEQAQEEQKKRDHKQLQLAKKKLQEQAKKSAQEKGKKA